MSSPNQSRRLLPVLALVLLTTLAACGKNGEPVLPDNTSGDPKKNTDNFPHQYPTSAKPQTGVFN
jgi:predicted small lipoprotein YifL